MPTRRSKLAALAFVSGVAVAGCSVDAGTTAPVPTGASVRPASTAPVAARPPRAYPSRTRARRAAADEGAAAPASIIGRPPPAPGTVGIRYSGGSVLMKPIDVYVIWYGDWSGRTTPGIVEDFARHIGGSPYFRVNEAYYESSGSPYAPSFDGYVSTAVDFRKSITRGYTHGKSLTADDVEAIVKEAIADKALPSDPDGVYFVATSKDVDESVDSYGRVTYACSTFCGWHTTNADSLKYSWLVDPARCPTDCEWQAAASPNGDAAADTLVSIFAHELEETATDPYLDAWGADRDQGEVGDLCAWTTGSTYLTTDGAPANVHLGTRDYLVQQDYELVTASCQQHLDLSMWSAAIGRDTSDFNGDGYADLLWQDSKNDVASIWSMFGTFPAEKTKLPAGPGFIRAIADFDGDKKADILWIDSWLDATTVWLMDGATIKAKVTLDLTDDRGAFAVGDFDGDGRAELIYEDGGYGDPNKAGYHRAGVEGGASKDLGLVTLPSTFPAWKPLGTGDFDGDGKSDLLWQDWTTGDVTAWLMDASGVKATRAFAAGTDGGPLQGGGPQVLGIGDLDGDGRAEVIAAPAFDSTDVLAWTLVSDTHTGWLVGRTARSNQWRLALVSDFNGDGRAELLWRHRRTGDTSLWWLGGGTQPTFATSGDVGRVSLDEEIVKD